MKQPSKPDATAFVVIQDCRTVFVSARFADALSFWCGLRTGAVYQKVVTEHAESTERTNSLNRRKITA